MFEATFIHMWGFRLQDELFFRLYILKQSTRSDLKRGTADELEEGWIRPREEWAFAAASNLLKCKSKRWGRDKNVANRPWPLVAVAQRRNPSVTSFDDLQPQTFVLEIKTQKPKTRPLLWDRWKTFFKVISNSDLRVRRGPSGADVSDDSPAVMLFTEFGETFFHQGLTQDEGGCGSYSNRQINSSSPASGGGGELCLMVPA